MKLKLIFRMFVDGPCPRCGQCAHRTGQMERMISYEREISGEGELSQAVASDLGWRVRQEVWYMKTAAGYVSTEDWGGLEEDVGAEVGGEDGRGESSPEWRGLLTARIWMLVAVMLVMGGNVGRGGS